MREPVRAKVTTADRAEVEAEPEERALGVADARSDAPARNRAVGTGKPYFYGAGRILGRVSRLYGYSMLLSGISSLFLSGFSSLPLTKWNDKDKGGVPKAHNELVPVLLMLWVGAGVSVDCRGQCAAIRVGGWQHYTEGTNGNSRLAKSSLLHTSTVFILLCVQHLDSRPVHRPRPTALLPAVRVVGDLSRQHDWMRREPLRLHRSPSRPRSQPQVFHAGRVSIVWCDLAIPCGYVQL